MLQLAVWDELTHAQIAHVVGCSESAVAVPAASRSESAASSVRRDRWGGIVTDERNDQLLEQLRRANPVPPDATAGRRLTADADALFADIVQGRVQPRPRPRSRRKVLIAVAVTIASPARALAAFFLRHEADSKQPASAACYPAADLRAHPVIVGVAGDDPRVPCAEQWRLGKLGAGPPPDFAVCVLPTGVQGVFPGESGSTCDLLHLPPRGPGRRDGSPRSASSSVAGSANDAATRQAHARLVQELLVAHHLARLGGGGGTRPPVRAGESVRRREHQHCGPQGCDRVAAPACTRRCRPGERRARQGRNA